MKGKRYSLPVIGVVLMLAGCSSQTKEIGSYLEIKSDGRIIHTVVDTFEPTYYDLAELEEMIREETEEYNQKFGAQSVKPEKTKLLDENVVLSVISYSDFSDYNHFNDKNLFVGTVPEASAAGYRFTTALIDVKDPSHMISNQEVSSLTDLNILITDETGNVKTSGEVLYISSDGKSIGAKEVSITEDMEGLCYIIYQ